MIDHSLLDVNFLKGALTQIKRDFEIRRVYGIFWVGYQSGKLIRIFTISKTNYLQLVIFSCKYK